MKTRKGRPGGDTPQTFLSTSFRRSSEPAFSPFHEGVPDLGPKLREGGAVGMDLRPWMNTGVFPMADRTGEEYPDERFQL